MPTFSDSYFYSHTVAYTFPIVIILKSHTLRIRSSRGARYILLNWACIRVCVQCVRWLGKSCVTLLSALQAESTVTDAYFLFLSTRLIT